MFQSCVHLHETDHVLADLGPILSILRDTSVAAVIVHDKLFLVYLGRIIELSGSVVADSILFTSQDHQEGKVDILKGFLLQIINNLFSDDYIMRANLASLVKRISDKVFQPLRGFAFLRHR